MHSREHAAKMSKDDTPDHFHELTHDDLPELLKHDLSVKVAGIDIDGMARGKLMSKKKFLSIAKDGFGFCSVIFGWDMHDQTYYKELKISNAENGYRDLIAEVDLSSYRRIPWENNIPFFLVSFRNPEGGSLSACPRSVLERAVDKIEAKGVGAMAGGEFNTSRPPALVVPENAISPCCCCILYRDVTNELTVYVRDTS